MTTTATAPLPAAAAPPASSAPPPDQPVPAVRPEHDDIVVWVGNPSPHECVVSKDGKTHSHVPVEGPTVTFVRIPRPLLEDGSLHPGGYTYTPGIDPVALLREIAQSLSRDGITRLPDHEALVGLVGPGGAWYHHGSEAPTWVGTPFGTHDDFLSDLAAYWSTPERPCAVGIPADLEDTHWTPAGPPGVIPLGDATMAITNNGRDMQSRMFGYAAGSSGTYTTAPTGTTVTLDSASAPGSTTFYNGQKIVVAPASGTAPVWGIGQGNTNASPPVVTVDRWYNGGTPGGAAATTPTASGTWLVDDAPPPAHFVAISVDSTSWSVPAATTTLPSEITTAGGGLIRKIGITAHTASSNTTTITAVYTANGSDSLPVTVATMGVFSSIVPASSVQTMFFATTLNATATLNVIGDQLTVTDTITGT